MEGFKTQSINIPEYIDWNSFEIKNMSSSQVIIYIHDLKKDISRIQARVLGLLVSERNHH